ncbi:MAG: hypothetical protein ACQER9_00965 [Nanobdellota archaeon]
MINLHIEPRKVYSWDEFVRDKGEYSISLDGFVNSKTIRDSKGPCANYNHHEDVDRLSTRSTSEQVYMDINTGLFKIFRKGEEPFANIFINDPDEDTCLSWWLLKNYRKVSNYSGNRIEKLVDFEDKMDCTGGAFPFMDKEMKMEAAWIFEPYNKAKLKGKIADMGVEDMKNIVSDVEKRIDAYIVDKSEKIKLKGHYKVLKEGNGWTMVKETGPESRLAMYDDGINAFISIIAERLDGSRVVTLGRKSEWIPFYIEEAYKRLNEAEKEIISNDNCWSGSNLYGGSPRKTGTKLSLEKICEIINSASKAVSPINDY